MKVTYASWKEPDNYFRVDDTFKGALGVLEWAYRTYDEELIYACSFGIEGMVLIDLIYRVQPHATIVFLDTGLHFQKTYALIEQVKNRYPKLKIELKTPALTLEEQEKIYGARLWEKDPDQCCHLRKVMPLKDTLTGATAWLSGLRREQSISRRHTNFVNQDDTFQSIKICPLIHWLWKDIWAYQTQEKLLYNELHDDGYPSIGCAPCTLPGDMATGDREGRWSDKTKTECGLHK